MKLRTLNEAVKKIAEPEIKGLGLSLTKIKTFDMCEYKYFLQYIKKEKVDKADFNPTYFKKGQLAHKQIESKIKGTVCDFKSTSLSDDESKKTTSNCEKVFEDPYVKDIIDKGETEKPYSLYITSEEEDGLIATASYSKKADFSGYIDFYAKIGNTIHVLDWKTGKANTDMSDDAFMQLYLYAKACQKLFGGTKFILSYFYVDHGKLKTKEINLSELNTKIEAIVSKGVKIPSSNNPDDYEAKPGLACKFCPYSKVKSVDGSITCEFATTNKK